MAQRDAIFKKTDSKLERSFFVICEGRKAGGGDVSNGCAAGLVCHTESGR